MTMGNRDEENLEKKEGGKRRENPTWTSLSLPETRRSREAQKRLEPRFKDATTHAHRDIPPGIYHGTANTLLTTSALENPLGPWWTAL